MIISMQYHNYIFDVYNKPNRLKIGRRLSNLRLFQLCTIEVMNERAACGKMAAMWQRRSPLASSAGESSSVYIYLCPPPSKLPIPDLDPFYSFSQEVKQSFYLFPFPDML